MKPTPTSWRCLHDREDRTVARIATIARNNTVFGGASALVYAKRLARLGGADLEYVVSDVYARSSGQAHSEYEAFECPECGTACLGSQAAYRHCQEDE